MLTIMSYFPGTDLLHGFSRLSKNVRAMIPNSGLLDQEKMIAVKPRPYYDSLTDKMASNMNFELLTKYMQHALRIATKIRICIRDYDYYNDWMMQ